MIEKSEDLPSLDTMFSNQSLQSLSWLLLQNHWLLQTHDGEESPQKSHPIFLLHRFEYGKTGFFELTPFNCCIKNEQMFYLVLA